MSSLWAGKWTIQKPTLWLLISTDLFRVSVILGLTKLPLGQWSDEMLAARMAKGDVAALDALYDRHAAMTLGIALKITGDQALAEQILHPHINLRVDPSQAGFFGWRAISPQMPATTLNNKNSGKPDIN
jgi:hypothetical protein